MIDFWLLCFVFLVFQCCLVSGFTYSKACRWIVPFNDTVSYWKSTGTGKTIESTIQNSLFSVEKAKLCEQHSLEKLAECLFEDPDIVFWTRFLSGVQLEKFYLLLTDWFEKNSQCPKLFVIHVQHGLGNRLRALASALAYVELIPHIPILIWECDHHMGAKWEDLFEDLSNVVISPVEDESLLKNPFGNFFVIDYMKVTTRQRYPLPLEYTISQHIYWKSAYLLHVVGYQSAQIIRRFHYLVKSQFSKLIPIQPLKQVILENCPREPFIGFHIRQRLLHEEKFVTKNPQLEYGYFSARIIDKYRSKNRVAYFCTTASTLLSLYPSISIYTAADSYLSYEQLFHCVQNKIAVDHRRLLPLSISTCENRSRLCIQKALVDLYCLSQSNLLFGSLWSSFTEVAHWLNSNDQSLVYLHTNLFFRNGSFRNETEFLMNVEEKLTFILS
ncbi:glycosyltransferase [Galdieria sulphuraria]|uniref:Glycosyltransferase n=1 Tax=Galdieria sulphuraria TaxID=130081 RepID=M2Y0C0_GALSU|nr:glycosyltransferase [Galdieria sulphuraria]EME29338.1 glycosyltransferase [Galdieria sulphuraria]|eukprot:XP_005705858.1 glycosyltransferase [Galdieria sulphuraria]